MAFDTMTLPGFFDFRGYFKNEDVCTIAIIYEQDKVTRLGCLQCSYQHHQTQSSTCAAYRCKQGVLCLSLGVKTQSLNDLSMTAVIRCKNHSLGEILGAKLLLFQKCFNSLFHIALVPLGINESVFP